MKNFYKILSKYRKQIILPVTVILLIVAFFNLYFILNVTPRSNDECLWVPKHIGKDSTEFVFEFVKVNGVTWNAGIRDGDKLLKIDGKEVKDLINASYLIDSHARGDTAVYTVLHNGKVINTKVEIKKLINFGGLSFVLLGMIWLLVGSIVVSAKPQGKTQLLFYRIGVALVLFSTVSLLINSSVANPIYRNSILLLIIDLVWSIAGVLLPFMFVHFFWVFPRKFKFMEKEITIKILYSLAGLLLVGALIYKFLFVYKLESTSAKYNMIFVSVINILIFLAFIIGFISLIINYFKLKLPQKRNPIFIILISYGIGIAALIYISTFASVLADTIFNSPEYYMPIILLVLLPIAFGYSIFKYSLMDVSDVVKNTIMYGAATVSVAGVYFLVIYVLGQQISKAITTEYQGLIAAGIFILFAIIFQSTKDRFQAMITRKFYPEQFAYRKVLLDFSNHISTVLGLENIINSVTNTFVESLRLEKFGLALCKPGNNNCILKREKGIGNKNLELVNAKNTLELFIEKKKKLNLPVVIERNDFKDIFPENYEELIREEIYTVIPMTIKSNVIGLLLFGLKHSGSQFSGKDIELLTAAANQTAISIENARLYEEEAKKIKLDRELAVAKQIQEKLLPQNIPDIEGLEISGTMIPAFHVGGDYYDIIKVSKTKLFIVVGDVSGKGLSASFYMSKLQTMVKLFCSADKHPKEILMEINKHISEDIDKHWFITMTIALFDVKEKVVKICRAGHTPLKIIRDGKIKTVIPKGMGIGLQKGGKFNESLQEETYHLLPGDLFVFTSDGIEETMDIKNNLFGSGRFDKVLLNSKNSKPILVLDDILKSLNNFRGSAEIKDDITLVLVKITKEIDNYMFDQFSDYIHPKSRLA